MQNHSAPELAVIVISLGAPPELVGAVRSVFDQDTECELVVVNSGGGDAKALLAANGMNVKTIETDKIWFAGAARNRGIEATSAPYVAFLASDCRAAAGWVAARLEKHKQGVKALGNALLPSPEDNPVSWASHLALYLRRLPQNSRLTALPYGTSFTRDLLEKHGPYIENFRVSEDSEYLSRLGADERPSWAPSIITYHLSPTRHFDLLKDQFARGRRAAAHWRPETGRLKALAEMYRRRRDDPKALCKRMRMDDEPVVRKALDLMGWCALAYCAGLFVGPEVQKRT